MKLIYLSGPIRDRRGVYYVRKNIRRAEKAMVKLCRMGFAVICPHKNTELLDGCIYGHQLSKDNFNKKTFSSSSLTPGKTCPLGDDGEFWIQMDLEILRRCDLIVTLKGYEESSGCLEEVAEASKHKIPHLHFQDKKQFQKYLTKAVVSNDA